jgi:hypothetical protein
MRPSSAIDPALTGAVTALHSALLAPEPEAVAPCLSGVQAAVAGLQALERQLAAHPPDEAARAALLRDLHELQRVLDRTARLIRSGSDFWAGWARLLGLDTGYTPAGLPGPPEPAAGGVHVSQKA